MHIRHVDLPDPIIRGRHAALPVPPKGLAFAIADLVLAGSWAASQDYRMMVRLDHGDTIEEYEEVIELRSGRSAASSLICQSAPKIDPQLEWAPGGGQS